jgi:hypothetical protein
VKTLILFALVGAGLYLAGVDFKALLGLDAAVVDTVLLVTGALFGLAFIVRTVWTIAYIASGQYALDKRLDQWIR